MSKFLIKHYDKEEHLMNIRFIDATPGEDIAGYTERQMAERCGFDFTVNNGERITYEFAEK